MTETNGIAAMDLRHFIERIERLEEEKGRVTADVKSVYEESKGQGFDAAIIRKIVAMRRKGLDEIAEEQQLIDLYLAALGEVC